MGYYVSICNSTFGIKKNNLDAALAALKALNGPEYDNHKIKPYGTGAGRPYYSWMSADWDETCSSVAEVLNMLDLETVVDEQGDLYITNFDSKWRSQITIFLSALAPYAIEGSFIEFDGEEHDDFWRFQVDDGALVEYRGVITWDRVGPINADPISFYV